VLPEPLELEPSELEPSEPKPSELEPPEPELPEPEPPEPDLLDPLEATTYEKNKKFFFTLIQDVFNLIRDVLSQEKL
jgi:hypothetical protein